MKSEFLFLAVSVVCSTLLREVECSGSSNLEGPCGAGNHTVVDSNNRLHSLHQNNGNCDDNLTVGWYKFEVNGRPGVIPHLCLKNNVCGTQLPMRIDLDGKEMPAGNETVDAHVCTSYNVLGKWDCCVLRQPVKIKKCAPNVYVYYLKPTDRCNVAYCVQEVGSNPSPSLTRKRGDVHMNSIRNSTTGLPISSEVQNETNYSSTGVYITSTTYNISKNASDVVSENVTTGLTETSIEITTVTAYPFVSVKGNTTIDEASTTTNAGVSHADTNRIVNWNVTTILPPTEIDASRRYNLTTESSVSVSNTISGNNDTTTENASSISDTITSSTTTIGSVNDTFTIQTTAPNLPCINWTSVLCKDQNTTCYLEPSSNVSYRVCADGNGCGITCDNYPHCGDESDESLCPSTTCPEGQTLCSDGRNCYTRCDGHVSCTTTGEDEYGCHSTTTTTSATNITHLTSSDTQNVTGETSHDTFSTIAHSTHHVTVTTESGSSILDNATADKDEVITEVTSSLESTALTSQDSIISGTSDQSLATTGRDTVTSAISTVHRTTDSAVPVNQTEAVTESFVTDSTATTTTNYSNQTETSTDQGVSESNIITSTASTVTNHTSLTEEATVGSVSKSSSTLQETGTSTQVAALTLTEIIATTEKERDSSISTESSSGALSSEPRSTDMQSSSPRYSSAETNKFVTTTASSNTVRSTDSNVSNGTSFEEPAQSSSTDTDTSTATDSTNSTRSEIEVTTQEQDLDGEQSSSGYLTTSAYVKTDTTEAVNEAETTLLHSTNTSSKISTVTAPTSASAGDYAKENATIAGQEISSTDDNTTEHTTVGMQDEETGLLYENFGLFVFLIVAGVVIFGICMFGIIGYTYQRRLRTWNPTMAYQDAYGDYEKKPIPFGRERYGVESPIPDFDILRDEKKFEETSLSQASTLAVGQTPARSAGPPFDDSYGEIHHDGLTNGKPISGECQQDLEVSYITDGQTTVYENGDGIVPVDEIDTAPPRALFPWIENAADTKL